MIKLTFFISRKRDQVNSKVLVTFCGAIRNHSLPTERDFEHMVTGEYAYIVVCINFLAQNHEIVTLKN